jgi:hypothetical protein
MELFLNVLWLAMATAALCVWRVRWTHQMRERDPEPWRQWTAFASALVLLFFMVSLTDDLHSELVYFEECTASRRHTACLACPRHIPKKHVPEALHGALLVSNFVPSPSPIGWVTPQNESSHDTLRAGLGSGRSPPVIRL